MCWPDLELTSYHDRGVEGMRWYVAGDLVGTAEVWLEPFRTGTIVHVYLRGDPDRPPASPRKAVRLRKGYVVDLKRMLFDVKDELEGRGESPYRVEVSEFRDVSRTAWNDPDDPSTARPIRAYTWRPDDVDEPPLVVLSHRTGGHVRELTWLAEPLVEAGFLVVAVEHHGCNLLDGVLSEGRRLGWERPVDLSYVLDRLEGFDERRIGVAGHGDGGYAAAALLGARIDGRVLTDLDDARLADATSSKADGRIRAAFLLAPTMGQRLDADSLAKLDRPVAIRWGDADEVAPPEHHGQRYAELIPYADGRSLGSNVGHEVFVGDQPDPSDLRPRVAAQAVAFFAERLRAPTS